MSAVIEWRDGAREEFGVMSIPGHKQKALYHQEGARVTVLAYFRDDQAADEAERLIDRLATKATEPSASGGAV